MVRIVTGIKIKTKPLIPNLGSAYGLALPANIRLAASLILLAILWWSLSPVYNASVDMFVVNYIKTERHVVQNTLLSSGWGHGYFHKHLKLDFYDHTIKAYSLYNIVKWASKTAVHPPNAGHSSFYAKNISKPISRLLGQVIIAIG